MSSSVSNNGSGNVFFDWVKGSSTRNPSAENSAPASNNNSAPAGTLNSFWDLSALTLNKYLKGSTDDGDVKAKKAILFNAATVVAVASVVLWGVGGLSLFGAAALTAISLVGRTIVVHSFSDEIITQFINEDSHISYGEPAKVTYGIFYDMNPLVKIGFQEHNDQGNYLVTMIRWNKPARDMTPHAVPVRAPTHAVPTHAVPIRNPEFG